MPFLLYVDLSKKLPSVGPQVSSTWGVPVDYYSKDRFPTRPQNALGDTDTSWVVPKGSGVQSAKQADAANGDIKPKPQVEVAEKTETYSDEEGKIRHAAILSFVSKKREAKETYKDKEALDAGHAAVVKFREEEAARPAKDAEVAAKKDAEATARKRITPSRRSGKPAVSAAVPKDGLALPDAMQAGMSEARQAVSEMIDELGTIELGEYDEDNDNILQDGTPLVVDQIMAKAGLSEVHKAWMRGAGDGIGWYARTTDSNALLGEWLIRDPSKDELDKLAKECEYKGDPQDLVDMARAQYATTQEVLARRLAKGELEGVDKDGYIYLYRGVKSKQGRNIKDSLANSDSVDLDVRSLSSWTDDQIVAFEFAGSKDKKSDGQVLQLKVHISRVFAQWEQTDVSARSLGGETEWILTYPEKKISLSKENLRDV